MNETRQSQPVYTVIDMINNKVAGKTRLVKTQDDIWVLQNTEGKLAAVISNGSQFKLTSDEIADAAYIVKPMKLTKEYIVVKILPIKGGSERRRYQRLPVPVAIKTKLIVKDQRVKGEIHELAFGSFIITTKQRLEKDEEIVVHLTELDGEAAYICHMYIQKESEHDDEDDIWFAGYKYVVLIDEKRSGEKAMEMLYSKISRLFKGQE